MPETCDELALYLHLARASEVRRRPLVRDKLLVLAGKTALEMRLDPVAEHCRAKILAHNPGHILRNYPTLAEALADDSFRAFYKRLAQAYPRERAEHMLRSLGILLAEERHLYADDLEYAAALLGTTPEQLVRRVATAAPDEPARAAPVPADATRPPSAAEPPGVSRGPVSVRVRRPIPPLGGLAVAAVTLLLIAGLVGFLLARLR
ncbi:MAG: hypothetical protein JNG90_12975 [Planctomycetaceae bacterium]|nr:hypothetical protein [Planctomycetaceae bacterium]